MGALGEPAQWAPREALPGAALREGGSVHQGGHLGQAGAVGAQGALAEGQGPAEGSPCFCPAHGPDELAGQWGWAG